MQQLELDMEQQTGAKSGKQYVKAVYCHPAYLTYVQISNRWGNNGNSDTLFSWAPKSLQMVTAAMKLKDACSLEEKL